MSNQRSKAESASAAPNVPDVAAVRDQVRRILASSPFENSERMSRFLHYAVERVLDGNAAELKEYVLGLEIFDRGPSFDPRIDPIVRVEARRLRAKLKSYYEAAGQKDEVVIELPTGSYVPRVQFRTGEPAGPADAALSHNIAVLPFANLSPEPDADYFSDGLTEELIHALTKVEGLQVVAWGSAVKMKDRQHDFAAIRRDLHVGTLVLGTVRKAGERIRIIARLVDTTSGFYLWSETYDRRLEDLFAIQEEISAAIVNSLCVRLLGPVTPGPRASGSVEAYDLYLKGRFHWNKRTPEGLNRAIEYFSQAIAVDPQFAQGHAGLSDAYSLYADHGLASAREMMPKAKAAALRALEIDPKLGEAHTSLAFIRSLYEWNWAEAGESYRTAIRLNPGYVTARHWYGCDYLALLGRFDDAIEEMRTAVRLDPLSIVMNESLAYVLMLARRYDQAIEQHLQSLELEPHFYKSYTAVGRVYIHKGSYDRAIEMLLKGRSLAGEIPNMLGALGQAYALAGREAEARSMLAQLERMASVRYVPSTAFALIHAGLGEPAEALNWLENAWRCRELPLSAINVHPGYDALRNDPRFHTLLRRLGFRSPRRGS